MKTKPLIADRLSRPPLARMLQIHERLREGRFPNCTKLASELEVATKTVMRDIDFMRDRMDLPIEFDFHRNGFHYTAPVQSFPSIQVTEKELVALYVAQKSLEQYKGTPFEKPLHAAFEKLTGGLSDRITFSWQDLESAISFRSMGATVADLELFEILSQSVMQSRELEFEYHKIGGRCHEPRKVWPYHLGCIENQWYLFAFDLDRKQMRTFALPRICNARVTSRQFVRQADFSMEKWLGGSFGVFKDDGKLQDILIQFDAFAGRLVRERKWHSSQKIKELKDGGIELSLKLGNLHEVLRWVLSWGEHARVMAPEELRSHVRQAAQQLAGYYS